MKALILMMAVLAASGRPASAQGAMYVVADPTLFGGFSSERLAAHVGVGLERPVGQGYNLDLSGGLVYLPPVDHHDGRGNGFTQSSVSAFLASVGASRHFHPSPAISPFWTAGFSMLAAYGAAGFLVHGGAGMDLRMGEHSGFRVEVRDHVLPLNGLISVLLQIRVGYVMETR